MKCLILGVNGMAGHMIALYLKEAGHSVIGFARRKSQVCTTIIGDALDKKQVKDAIGSDEYDLVINCIGVLNKAVDKNLTDGIYLNSVLPHYIADCVQSSSAKLIHISTDCVFSGRVGDYREDSIPDEISMYGKTKSLGEVIDNKNLTIRTSIIGPELKSDGIGLFHWFMKQTASVPGFTKAIWTGVTTLELAKAIVKIGEEVSKGNDITGLYHLVNNQKISKYELLHLFNQFCRKETIEINRDDSFISDKSIINTRDNFEYTVPSYEKMVQEMGTWIASHKELYKQYDDC